MKLGIVMPVVIQNPVMLKVTLEAVQHISSTHHHTLYVVSNRLHSITPDEFSVLLHQAFKGDVRLLHEPGVERSVAGAWNYGCKLAMDESASHIAIVANDTRLKPDCLDRLAEFGGATMYSGISYNDRGQIDPKAVTDGCDFSCFMLTVSDFIKHGQFDTNFRPAYFEDNDYYGRIVLGGGTCQVVHGAQFFHHGSMTIKQDPERATHVQYWFEKNKEYFARKWGVPSPEGTQEGVLLKYFRHPFNDRRKPLSWFPTDSA